MFLYLSFCVFRLHLSSIFLNVGPFKGVMKRAVKLGLMKTAFSTLKNRRYRTYVVVPMATQTYVIAMLYLRYTYRYTYTYSYSYVIAYRSSYSYSYS